MWDRREQFRRFGPAALVAALCLALYLHALRYLPFLSDDALISLRYARRFGQGLGLTWSDGDRVEGYTNLLWVLLTGACGALGFDLVWSARVLDTIGSLAVVVCASCLPKPLRLSPLRTLTGGLFAALAAPLAVWAIGGLEQGFLAGVLAGALLVLGRGAPNEAWSSREGIVAGALLGAVALLRADGFVLVLAATGGFALAGKLELRALGRAALVLAIPVGVLCLQLLFRYVYYGALVPNTALVKVTFNHERLLGGLYYLRDGYRPLLPALGLTLVAFVAGFRGMRRERWIPALTVLVGWSSYVGLVGGDIFPGWRHLVPAVTALAMLLAEAAHAASGRFRFGTPVVLGVALPTLVAGLVLQLQDRENIRAKNERWEWDGRPLGQLLKRAFSKQRPLLAVDAAGSLPYWSELPSLDLLGLNDRYLATHRPPTFGTGQIGHDLGDGAYVLKRRPDIFAFNGAIGSSTPAYLSGRQAMATLEFQRDFQYVRARGPRAALVGELFMRREGGKIGVTRGADRIDVPGYFFAGGWAVAELDARDRLVTNNPGPNYAELPKFVLPPGTWELVLDTNLPPTDVAFRCGGVSAAQTGAAPRSIGITEPTAVDVVVGAAKKGVLAIRSASFVRSSAPAGFRCWPANVRLIVPLSQVSQRKAPHSDWAAVSNVVFRSLGLRVELPGPSHARVVDLSVDGNDRYDVLFARGSQVEATTTIEKSKKGGGLAVHEVTVPPQARATGFDRIELVPLEGDNYYSAGHVLLED